MSYRFGTVERCWRCRKWDDVLVTFSPVEIELCLPCAQLVKQHMEGEQ